MLIQGLCFSIYFLISLHIFLLYVVFLNISFFFFYLRRYCTARLRRLYKSLKFTHGRGKYTRRAITESTVTEVRYVLVTYFPNTLSAIFVNNAGLLSFSSCLCSIYLSFILCSKLNIILIP